VFSLSDTHCHLDFHAFDEDRQLVLARAREAGVERILNPGIDIETSRKAVELAGEFEEVFAAVGVHPNEALGWQADTLDQLRSLAGHRKVVAIGEIGLDYYRERTPHDLQKTVFRQQLDLARELGLPVVVHTRDASTGGREATCDAIDMLAVWIDGFAGETESLRKHPGVLHSFAGGIELAKKAVELNLFIGVTGPITFPKAEETRMLVAELGLEHLLVETDAPFLTPVPYRGQRNEPGYVRFVAKKISEILNLPFDEVLRITSSNADRLFANRQTYRAITT
jgi:TatD DNase family protein